MTSMVLIEMRSCKAMNRQRKTLAGTHQLNIHLLTRM